MWYVESFQPHSVVSEGGGDAREVREGSVRDEAEGGDEGGGGLADWDGKVADVDRTVLRGGRAL